MQQYKSENFRPDKITMDEVHAFFDTKNSMKCKTKIVYLNRQNDGCVLSDLYVKKVDIESRWVRSLH